LSRDPIAEKGGFNLYGIVHNNPINNWDVLGQDGYYGGEYKGVIGELMDWFFDKTGAYEGCCDGKKFDKRKKCCLDGKLTNKQEVDTGIRQITQPGTKLGFNVGHSWVGENGSNWAQGLNPDRDDWWIPHNGRFGNGEPKVDGATSTPVKLSPCKYDIEKFTQEIKRLAAQDRKDDNTWYIFLYGGHCQSYARHLIDRAKSNSRR